MFQNLRPSATIYVLDKTSGVPELKVGQVVNVGNLTPVYNTQTPSLMAGFQTKMELTIRAKVDESEGDFPHLPADKSSHNYGGQIVADSREAMLSEVDIINHEAQHRLDSRENDEATVEACCEIYKLLNPDYAKEKERDETLEAFNDRLDGIEESVGKILKLLNKK